MKRFLIVALLLMAWAYWELSGGADFTPEHREVAESAPEPPAAELTPESSTGPATAPEAIPAPVADPAPPSRAEAAVEELQIEAAVEAAMADADAGATTSGFNENPLTTQAAPPESTTGPATEPEPEPVAEAPPAPAGTNLHVVTGSRVNLREGPGTSFATTGQVTAGTILEVLEIRDGWAYIALQGNGDQGWMSASFLAPL